jgi:hypothetical protein
MTDRVLSFLVALSLAFLAWLYLRSRDQEMLDNVPIPVQIELAAGQAEHYDLEVSGSSQVPVSFSGPPSRIRELRKILQRGELHVETVLTVPDDRLQEARYLDTVRIQTVDIHPPRGVTATLVEGRNSISVTLHRLVERRLPVHLEHAPQDRIAQVVLEPATVLVRGPEEILARTRSLPTSLYTLAGRGDSVPGAEEVVVATVPVVQELEGRPVHSDPSSVTARITLQPQQKLYELTDVPVQFLCPANFPLRPLFGDERAGKITLRLLGPAGDEPPAVVAFIDLGGRKWEPGLYEEPLRLQLPKEFQLAQSPPRLVAFQLVPVEAPAKGTAPGHAF